MQIDPGDLGAERIYRLMTGIVVPRPIAWVTSLSPVAPLQVFQCAACKMALACSTSFGRCMVATWNTIVSSVRP